MIKEFHNLDEIQKYYDEKSNTYVFKENDEYIDLVVLNFDLEVQANIEAKDIKGKDIMVQELNARDITAEDIEAWNIMARDIHADDIFASDMDVRDINARDIEALDISADNIEARDIGAKNIKATSIKIYYALCFAYENITCRTIVGKRDNHKHFVLDDSISTDVSMQTMREKALEIPSEFSKHDGELESGNKALKALNIIKEKIVDIDYILTCFDDEKGGFKEYNAYVGHDEDKELTQEEYDLLKEELE
ncbi:MAG: hypothetical protein PUD59_06855 [bacterium]|nr:hypothetical protein [bacterium]